MRSFQTGRAGVSGCGDKPYRGGLGLAACNEDPRLKQRGDLFPSCVKEAGSGQAGQVWPFQGPDGVVGSAVPRMSLTLNLMI